MSQVAPGMLPIHMADLYIHQYASLIATRKDGR